MGYNKIVTYGKRLELYKYERELLPRTGKRNCPSDYGTQNSGNGRKDTLQSGLVDIIKKSKRKDNARRSGMAFKRLVLCNLSGRENPLLLTLTYAQNQGSLSDAYRDFTSFVQALRYKCGKIFKYICVPEFQKRGAVHFHALLWGVQKDILGLPRQYPNNSIDCYYWSNGFAFLKETNGHDKIASYLSKYMVKSFQDDRLVSKKAYVASRNITRPYCVGGLSDFSLDCVVADYMGVDNVAVQSRSYLTQYLDSCDYQLFINNSS